MLPIRSDAFCPLVDLLPPEGLVALQIELDFRVLSVERSMEVEMGSVESASR